MTERYDVIVVGVGSMGASACDHLARRDARVLGLERSAIPHNLGAHHGQSRVIRLAYFEHPDYVPLLRRSYENWRDLEARTAVQVLWETGGLYLGPPESLTIAGSLRAMDTYSLPHEQLTHAQVRQRYPMFHLPDDHVGLIEPVAGFLCPELAVATMAEQALRHGAELHGHEPVTDWQSDMSGVSVTTARQTYRADRVIFTAGAWTSRLVRDLGIELRVTRQVLGWVWPKRPELFELGRFPIWVIDSPSGGVHYGFPMRPERPGFKLALHAPADVTDPDEVDRNPRAGDEATFRPILERVLPDANGPLLSMQVCLYTSTPDSHFIIDNHPRHDRVILGCGFSGHGFKMASAIGEALADLGAQGRTELPVGFLGLRRFAGG